MSINLYLKDSVRELSGFKSVLHRDGSASTTFNGMHVFDETSRPYLMFSWNTTLPDELKDVMDEISCYETIPQMGRRESGIYRHNSAQCELTPADDGNAKREKPVYRLKITAKNLEDVQAIIRQIKIGSIRPDESYEGQQSGMSRAELATALQQAQEGWERSLLQATEALALLRSAQEKITKIIGLGRTLTGNVWPFCTKMSMVGAILKIVNENK